MEINTALPMFYNLRSPGASLFCQTQADWADCPVLGRGIATVPIHLQKRLDAQTASVLSCNFVAILDASAKDASALAATNT